MSLADDASLLLIPSGYKSGKVYSVFPTDGDGDFTFSRTGDATRINPGGYIETVGTNTPRIDHSGGGCPSLLLEPQRTNNILNSESLSNASWTKYNSGAASTPIITDNYALSPSGEMNASRLQMSLGGGTTSSDRTFIRQSLTSQTNYYFSVYLKSTNGEEQKLNWHFGSDGFLITVTDEWQRFELNVNSSARSFAGIGLRGNLLPIGIDDSVDILVYGFQVEQGSYATSYIPTNGSAVTRNADSCNGAGNSDLFNDGEGTLFVDILPYKTDNSSMNIGLSDSSVSDRISIIHYPNNEVKATVVSGGSTVFSRIESVSYGQRYKIAVTYKKDEFKFYRNGLLIATDTSGNNPTGLNKFSFTFANGSFRFEGKVYDSRYYDKTLTDTELQELTTL